MDNTGERLREQLIRDMDRLHRLIVRVARGVRCFGIVDTPRSIVYCS